MFGLAGLVVVAAMAFVGATSASATTTQLCKVHKEPCPAGSAVTSIHMVNVGAVPVLLNSTADVLCLSVLAVGTPLELASPQIVDVTQFTFSNCGTNAAHNNCTVTALELPKLSVLKTALNLGTLTAPTGAGEGRTNVKCTILGFIKINCDYKGAGLSFGVEGAGHTATAGHGMLTSLKTSLPLSESLEGGGLCPSTSSIDALLEPLEDTYIVS